MKEIVAIVLVPHRVKFVTDVADTNEAARRAAAAIKTAHSVAPVLHSVLSVDDQPNVEPINKTRTVQSDEPPEAA